MIKANIFIELFLTLNFCKFFWKEINDLKKLKYFLFNNQKIKLLFGLLDFC